MRLTRLHIALLVLAVAGCSHSGLDPESLQAVVDIHASIDDKPIATKALVDFNTNDTYGIFTCIHEDTSSPSVFAQFRPSLWNAQAYVSGGWKYKNVSYYSTGELYSTGSEKFILMGRNDNAAADLYAYSPWDQNAYASGPTAIPFSRQTDLKYAEQNTANENQNLNPASVAPLSATFHFRRVMAYLVFDFTLDTPNNTTMQVNLVSIKDADTSGGAVLYTGGKFNAITGTLYDLNTAEELTANLGYCTVGDGGGSFGICLVPTDVVADDELVFTFNSGGFKLPPFVLKMNQVRHSDGTTYGFKAGYKYTFHFHLDNYVRFSGFDIQPWGAEEDLPYHGVI